jgi:hypothetical protein
MGPLFFKVKNGGTCFALFSNSTSFALSFVSLASKNRVAHEGDKWRFWAGIKCGSSRKKRVISQGSIDFD